MLIKVIILISYVLDQCGSEWYPFAYIIWCICWRLMPVLSSCNGSFLHVMHQLSERISEFDDQTKFWRGLTLSEKEFRKVLSSKTVHSLIFCDVFIFAELEMNFGDCERFEISYEVISARSLSSSLDELDVTVTNLPSRLFHLSFSSLTSGGRFLFRKDEIRSTGS